MQTNKIQGLGVCARSLNPIAWTRGAIQRSRTPALSQNSRNLRTACVVCSERDVAAQIHRCWILAAHVHRNKILDDLSRDRDDAAVPTSFIRLGVVAEKESLAIKEGEAALTHEQAEAWCALHVNDNWYELPLMLVAKGYNGDYDNFTQVGADSVYDFDESG